jgi:hypothetical protein
MSQLALLLQVFLFTARIWRSIAAINQGHSPHPRALPLELVRVFTFTLFAGEIPRRASQFSPLKMIAPECQPVFMPIAPPLWVVSRGFHSFNKRGSENADRSPRAFFTE